MDFLSLRDLYDLLKYLTEEDLYGLYESAFNETKKKYPLMDKKEAQLSQINDNMRDTIGDLERYKDREDLKKEIFAVYCREMKGEIPEEMLNQFLDDLFGNLEAKIREHPKIRDRLEPIKTDEILQLIRDTRSLIEQSLQCRTGGEIQTPEGGCKTDFLIEGFVGKVNLILGTHVNILGEINRRKVLNLVEKMEGDPEYHVKNVKLASEVCNFLIESFDHLPREAKDARIAFSIILSKLTGIAEPLLACEIPSTYGELNFQAYTTLSTLALNEGDVGSARSYFRNVTAYAESGERVPMVLLEGRILIAEYRLDAAINQLESILDDADFFERKTILYYLGLACYNRSYLQKCLRYWNDLKEIEDNRRKRSTIIGNIGLVYRLKGDLDNALKYLQDALQIHRDIGYKQGEASDLGNIGLVYRLKGNFNKALKYLQDALQIDRDIGYKQGEASDLGNMGVVFRLKGDLDEALSHHKKALQIHKDIGYREGEANQLGNMGVVFRLKGDLDEALSHHKKALQIHKNIGYKQGEASDLGNIGVIYQSKGDLDNALKYLQDALQIDRDIGYREGEANQLGNIGVVYRLKGDLDEALKYLQKALQIHKDMGYKQEEATHLGNIGIVLNLLGKNTEALHYLSQSLEIFEKIGMKREADIVSNHIQEICMKDVV